MTLALCSTVSSVESRCVRNSRAMRTCTHYAQGIENRVPFSRDERLGWLTFCPTNLGSTVRYGRGTVDVEGVRYLMARFAGHRFTSSCRSCRLARTSR